MISEKAKAGSTGSGERTYLAIDLKSFYASAECADRKLDPLTTNLVVADISRTEKTICLAVSPSLKAVGVPGRPRLFEVIEKVKNVNADRLQAYRKSIRNYNAQFKGTGYDATALASDLSLELNYIIAPPRMNRYMEVSSQIYGIYLKYVDAADVIVYSIDEVFIDVTPYLHMYGMSAQDLAMTMIREVLYTTGITATAGIGTNLYLAKVAMDIVAKHVPPDANGVRMAELDEMSYRHILWSHKPLTDFWRVGPGIARRLMSYGMNTMGDIARMSCRKGLLMVKLDRPKKGELKTQIFYSGEDFLYRLFGVNAELLIDHAWGWEPTTVDYIKQYKPQSNSLSSGQVLHEPYTWEKARVIVNEMADDLSLSLVRKGLVCNQVELYICFDRKTLVETDGKYYLPNGDLYTGQVITGYYGDKLPKHANGGIRFDFHTASTKMIVEAMLSIYDEKVDKRFLVRRVNLAALNLISEQEAKELEQSNSNVQLDMFTDYAALEEEKKKLQEKLEREKRLQKAAVVIRERFGKNALLKGTNFREGARQRERNNEVGGHRGGEEGELNG